MKRLRKILQPSCRCVCHKQADHEIVVTLALQVLIGSHLQSVTQGLTGKSGGQPESLPKSAKAAESLAIFLCVLSFCNFDTRSTVVKAKSQFSILKANQQLLNPTPHAEWAHWIKVIKGELMHLRSSVRVGIYEETQYDGNCLLF
ncbi:hypothetical protein GOODEAATRI_007296 [Goodea atripinnis]|uniref:Uncharacterized protein n=1 Tax=Goodea atripinnis TaxID=208336 RepID=A0ABV0P2E6_9TELE